MKMLERKRKFIVAVTALVMSFVLALLGVLDGGAWATSVAAIVGLYGAAEAAEGWGHAKHQQQYPRPPVRY